MKGSVIFNGNMPSEAALIETFKDRILNSNHELEAVRDSKKVLLITAAWQKREFTENHIKKALYKIGHKPNLVNGFDQNIQNLCLYHDFNQFKAKEPQFYKYYHRKQQVIQHVKLFYRQKNSGLISILRKQLEQLKDIFPNITLHQILSYATHKNTQNLHDLNQLELLFHYACKDIQNSMETLRENDKEMLRVCKEIDDHFFINSKVAENNVYIQLKNQLEQRILSSNSIFIFGGNIAVLFNRLNFFKLRDTFQKALKNGTNFYTVSAGSMSLCDYIIVTNEESEWTGNPHTMLDLELFDQGFGLVKKILFFPHVKDYFQIDNHDTVTYMVNRFKDKICLGLDQGSFLLMETYEENGQELERFTSVGHDEGLYILNKNGKVTIKKYGEELELEGTKALPKF